MLLNRTIKQVNIPCRDINFESFVSGVKVNEKVQEAAYLGASYSMLSPVYSLDQTDTIRLWGQYKHSIYTNSQ
jgi:outer membrane protein assembly factor BamD